MCTSFRYMLHASPISDLIILITELVSVSADARFESQTGLILSEIFRYFPYSLETITGKIPRIGHHHFLENPFNHHPSVTVHSTLYNVAPDVFMNIQNVTRVIFREKYKLCSFCRIWGSNTGCYEEFYLLVYNAVKSVEILQTFRRKISEAWYLLHTDFFLCLFDPEDGDFERSALWDFRPQRPYIYIYIFPVAPNLEHRASVKRFVSLQFLNPKTVGSIP
jgi:hypothetical protein